MFFGKKLPGPSIGVRRAVFSTNIIPGEGIARNFGAQLGICSELRPLNTTRTLSDHEEVI